MAFNQVWDDVFKTRPWGKYPGEDIIRFVARNFYKSSDRGDIRILEVGSGTGANLWYIAREGFQAYGIEGSETGKELTVQRLDEEVPGWKGEIIQGDIINLPYSDNFFDAVIDVEACSCNSFEDTSVIYSEMARVLKSDGMFYSKCFSKGCEGDGIGENIGYNYYIPDSGSMSGIGPVRFTSKNDISNLLPDNLELSDLDQIVLRGNLTDTPILEWLITARKK